MDDDAAFLAAVQRAFRKSFLLDVAASGEEALARHREFGPYAVAVVDLTMPGMDGVELLSRLAVEAPSTVPVVLTGDVNIETFAAATGRTDVFRYVAKSPDGEVLRGVLIEALRESVRRSS